MSYSYIHYQIGEMGRMYFILNLNNPFLLYLLDLFLFAFLCSFRFSFSLASWIRLFFRKSQISLALPSRPFIILWYNLRCFFLIIFSLRRYSCFSNRAFSHEFSFKISPVCTFIFFCKFTNIDNKNQFSLDYFKR